MQNAANSEHNRGDWSTAPALTEGLSPLREGLQRCMRRTGTRSCSAYSNVVCLSHMLSIIKMQSCR